jgi:ATP-dependent exoDNAse (exonuclease V) alpha subunit
MQTKIESLQPIYRRRSVGMKMRNIFISPSLGDIELNEQFKKALGAMEKTKKNVFITGKAGTGKSTLLDCFCRDTSKAVAVLAPTGVAAVNINGQTIHSFFGFKPNITVSEAEKIADKTRNKNLFKKLEAIVIDEISMVRADLLDCVDAFLKTILKKKNTFGGMQMIFIGDLYQLPPVLIGEDKNFFKTHYKSQYFFDANAMKNFNMEFIELEKVYRQKDRGFIELLNSIRNNSTTEEQIKIINQRFDENCGNLGQEGHIYLTTTNKMADEINELNLNKLLQKLHIFEGEIRGEFDLKYLPTEIDLKLKKDSQIMLLNNDRQGRWINGTIGKIDKIEKQRIAAKLSNGKNVWITPFTWEIHKLSYDNFSQSITKDVVGSFTQMPIKLAWAITIHKSQGKTFDKAIIDIGAGTFTHGQMYVALSRCRNFEGIILKKKIKKSNIWMDWRVVKFLTNYQYQLSEKICSMEEKIEIIRQAIENKKQVEIVYLKSKDEKSKRIILPVKMGEMEYLGYKYQGVEAYCYKRGESRIFRIDRILEIKICP